MRSVKKFLHHIVYLNIIVAISTGLLSGGFCYYLLIPNWIDYGLLAFFSTLAVYNGQRLFKSRSSYKTPWLKWVDDNKRALYGVVVVFAIAAVVFMLRIGFKSNLALLLLTVSVIVSMFYVIPLGQKNLREIPFVKIHLIAISWAVVLIVFPMLNESVLENVLWFASVHYLYIIAVAIPFDIRDLKHDSSTQKTIPQVLGVARAKALALLLIAIFGACMFYIDGRFIMNPFFYAAVFVQIGLILLMTERKSDIYTAGWMDAAISLLGISYFL